MSPARLFRAEAVEFHRQGGARGDVVQLTPRAFFFTHWLLLVLLVAGVWFACVGTIDEYASGPALVRIDGLHELTAQRAAVVSGVEVAPGQRVHPGQALVRMHSASESAELEGVVR